jgi:hypothetical protein
LAATEAEPASRATAADRSEKRMVAEESQSQDEDFFRSRVDL